MCCCIIVHLLSTLFLLFDWFEFDSIPLHSTRWFNERDGMEWKRMAMTLYGAVVFFFPPLPSLCDHAGVSMCVFRSFVRVSFYLLHDHPIQCIRDVGYDTTQTRRTDGLLLTTENVLIYIRIILLFSYDSPSHSPTQFSHTPYFLFCSFYYFLFRTNFYNSMTIGQSKTCCSKSRCRRWGWWWTTSGK